MAVPQFVANTASTPGTPLIASLINGLVQSTSYIQSGGLPSTSASLTIAVPAVNGVVLASTGIAIAVVLPLQNITLTASRDTYLDLVSSTTAPYAGSLAFTGPLSVANGAAAPALTANSVRLCKVVTSGTAATSVVDLRPLTPQATAPGLRQVRTGTQSSAAGFSSTTVADWSGTPTVALTTQPGGSLRVRLTLPLAATGPVSSTGTITFFCNVDGANLATPQPIGLLTTTGGFLYTLAASIWTASVAPGPHAVKLQAQMAATGWSVGAQTTGGICLDVEEYA